MITVTIKLSGLLRNYYRSSISVKNETTRIMGGATVSDLLEQYNIPTEKAHMIIINRTIGELNTRLKSGDEIWILPLAAGG